MSVRRTSETTHSAGGHVVTGPLSAGGVVDVTSKLVVKQVQANSSFAGRSTVLSGTASIVVSMSNVKSDSIIQITPVTANASNQVANYVVASVVDGKSFMMVATGNVVAPVPISYQVIETI